MVTPTAVSWHLQLFLSLDSKVAFASQDQYLSLHQCFIDSTLLNGASEFHDDFRLLPFLYLQAFASQATSQTAHATPATTPLLQVTKAPSLSLTTKKDMDLASTLRHVRDES